jgi:anaerobic selenocysteine-containing dehydrogenase
LKDLSADLIITTSPSVCPLDCPDRCSLAVEVRGSKVRTIRGTTTHPLTDGFICTKVSRFARRVHGPDRILFPQRRIGRKGEGEFERIPWVEAIAAITARIEQARSEFGGEAILPFNYGGSNGLLTQGCVDAHFFRRLGASRLARTLCAASTSAATAALYGKMPGVAFEDYAEAKFILLWGANPRHSNIHLVPHLKAARRRGCTVAAVDPRQTLGDDLVTIRLQPYPGTDVVLALAMIRHMDRKGLTNKMFLEQHTTGWQELLEAAQKFPLDQASSISGVPAADIARLAEDYASADPALIRCGWGLERNRNGLSSVAAVLALPAVAGKFGRPGAGYTLSNSSAYQVDDAILAGAPEPSNRILNMNRLGRLLMEDLKPPIQVLIVYNCNPAATLPDHNSVLAGLRRKDLYTVVLDQVMTDTAAFADILLPATTFLEHFELNRSYGGYAVQLSEPVIPAQGEAKSNAEIFQMLGRELGWQDGLFCETTEELLRRAVKAVQAPMQSGFSLEMLQSRKIAFFDFPGARPIQFCSVFPGTADGKVHLYASELGSEPYQFREDPTTPEHPLAMISPSTGKTISSTLAEFNLTSVKLDMHPVDADARQLREGDWVRVFNRLGEVHCALRIEARLRPGVVSLAKGMWRRSSLNGSVGNALVPGTLTPVSGGACFNDARVEVEKL